MPLASLNDKINVDLTPIKLFPLAQRFHFGFVLWTQWWSKGQELFVHGHFKTAGFALGARPW